MAELPADTLERLLAGELPPDEQRRLAQEALDDPELFELLTAAGVVTAPLAGAAPPQVARPHHARYLGLAAALAAAAVVMVVVSRWPADPTPAVPQLTLRPTPAIPFVLVEPPVLLSAWAPVRGGPAFRAEGSTPRLPRPSGGVVSVADGRVEIDLGSIDGVALGQVVTVRRGGRTATLTIATVFRDRARGTIASGASGPIEAGDLVELPVAVHVGALLEKAAALRATGERNEAARMVTSAVDAAANLPALRAEALNDAAVLAIERRDYAAAGVALEAASVIAEGATRWRVANNQGALAALSGDRARTEDFYRRARTLAAGDPSAADARAAIDRNLDALARSK